MIGLIKKWVKLAMCGYMASPDSTLYIAKPILQFEVADMPPHRLQVLVWYRRRAAPSMFILTPRGEQWGLGASRN